MYRAVRTYHAPIWEHVGFLFGDEKICPTVREIVFFFFLFLCLHVRARVGSNPGVRLIFEEKWKSNKNQ